MEWFRFSLSALCIFFGLFTFIVGVLGVFQFKFVMNRMHSGALLDTMGLFFIILGIAISRDFDSVTIKLLFVVGFLWLTSPISSHFIAKLEYITDENLNDEIENELQETKKVGEDNDTDFN